MSTITSPDSSIVGQRVARFADIEVLRYRADGFEALPLREKNFVYTLSQATIAGRDIFTDQCGTEHLSIRALLETIYLHCPNKSTDDYAAVTDYLQRVWFANGIFHHYGRHRMAPGFSEKYLRIASKEVADYLPFVIDINEVCFRIFSEAAPQTSAEAVSFYAPGTRDLAIDFYAAGGDNTPASPGLNTRLDIAANGKCRETPWSISGNVYTESIGSIVNDLTNALAFVGNDRQEAVIRLLIDYYHTGDLHKFDEYCRIWVSETDAPVDFINGFIETYLDPLGIKGSWESIVQIRDIDAGRRLKPLADEAAWFEANAPIPPGYRKANPCGTTAAVVHAAGLGGDSYPSCPLGINLPNADTIRLSHGSKSVRLENIHHAYEEALRHSGFDEAFIEDIQTRTMLSRYGTVTSRLHTDLHECLGHGSGCLAPGVSSEALGVWHSVIEETRADLFALYYIADPRMVELGFLPDADAYQAEYYRFMHNGLIGQLVRIEPGHEIEEAHMRNRALIARYTLQHAQPSGAMTLEGLQVKIRDYTCLRSIIAELLHETQRIKSEGDAEAAKALILRYAVKVDADLHADILQCYHRLNIAPYRGFVNPRYYLSLDACGNTTNVIVDYTEGYEQQMLRYGRISSVSRLRDFMQHRLKPVCHQTPTEDELTQPEGDCIRSLRRHLYRHMDGEVAAQIRAYGLGDDICFGITRPHLQALSSEIQPSASIARYLRARNVRELRLLAPRLFPADELDAAEAMDWAMEAEQNVELRYELPALLLERNPRAFAWAFGWLRHGLNVNTVACITLARCLRRYGHALCAIEIEELTGIAIDLLCGNTAVTAHAAAMLLKFLAHSSPEANLSIRTAVADLSQRDKRPEVCEYCHDILFAINELIK